MDKKTIGLEIKGSILTPGDEGYEESLKRWSANFEKKAGYVVLVESPEDISKTIVWATANKLDLAVKCGGHSGTGASSSEGGVVVDLSRLNQVKVDAEKHLAFVQGGAFWSGFNTVTAEHGFAGVSGTVDHTGVGGLITGGGYGFLTGQYGLVIDNLVEATVVVADGRIVKASENENPDLFWGIRGGGSNFGVVYEFVLRIYPHKGTCFGGFMVLTPDKIPEVVSAFDKFWAKAKPDSSCHIVVGALPPENQPMIIVMPFCDTADEAEAKERFAEFYAIGPVLDNTKMHSYVEQNTVISDILYHGPRTYMKGFGYASMSVELLQHAFGTFSSYVSHIGEDYEISAIAFEAYPTDKICSVSSDSTAYPSRGRHINCVVTVRWKSSSLDDWVKGWVKSYTQEARAIDRKVAIEQGKEPIGNVGYANVSLPEERTAEWFGENFAKMREVKKKWDPEQRFNKWFPVPPAP